MNASSEKGITALHNANYNGEDKSTMVQKLIEAGADVNKVTKAGLMPLINTAYSANQKSLVLLIEAGANVNASSEKGITALHNTASNDIDSSTVVRKLIEAGADVNMATKARVTPLMNASCSGHEQSLQLLIEAGADMDTADSNGVISLMNTAINGYVNCLELLIKSNVDVNMQISGRTALMLAASYGHSTCAGKLIEAGADVNICNHKGDTVLNEAARKSAMKPNVINNQLKGRLPCLKLLLNAGAHVNIKNNSGLNSLGAYLAEETDEEVIMLLFAAGETSDGISYIPDCLQEPDDLQLQHICRNRIRNHLLELDSHSHLFGRIPRLGLPDPLIRYLLYHVSLVLEEEK